MKSAGSSVCNNLQIQLDSRTTIPSKNPTESIETYHYKPFLRLYSCIASAIVEISFIEKYLFIYLFMQILLKFQGEFNTTPFTSYISIGNVTSFMSSVCYLNTHARAYGGRGFMNYSKCQHLGKSNKIPPPPSLKNNVWTHTC